MNKLLCLDNVSVQYGNIGSLRNISLSIQPGEIACLIGANGAGKSTLLKAIVGLVPLTTGIISFENNILAAGKTESAQLQKKRSANFPGNRKTDKIIGFGMSLVPEGREVFPQMSVIENLEMGAYLVKSRQQIEKTMREMFDLFPILLKRGSQKAGSLSGGEQQMLAIARALMSKPRLLLLDEPGLGLAPLIIRDIFEVIVRINRDEGVTVFLVEQNAKMALTIASHGFVMETGSIKLHDTGTNLLNNDQVHAAYLGE